MNATTFELRDAMDAHDAEGMAAQFAPNHRSEQPARPNRSFGGHAQVAADRTSPYRAVSDLVSEVVAEIADGAAIEETARQLGEAAR
jgi:hypothetical protein